MKILRHPYWRLVVTENKLRVLRAERRVSQLRVAMGAGLGTTRYWAIENALAEPTEAERLAIARVLGVDDGAIWLNVPPAGDVAPELAVPKTSDSRLD